MKISSIVAAVAVGASVPLTSAYTTSSKPVNRRDALFGVLSTGALTFLVGHQEPAVAFDGSGSSAYAGMAPSSKAALKKSYEARIAADVRDFNELGKAIKNGETEGDAWVNFFIQFARREPDDVGRTYAALADFLGPPDSGGGQHGGGDGYLLAATFTKPGKPSDNTPAVKKYNSLAKSFAGIKAAGKKGDAAKAKQEWEKTSILFEDYLDGVEMPGSLTDSLYN
mmetsp:Transcript_25727/g.36302  ORF Transcript_25727/g.36302 Transcript_25727/m.36302 type:complete len:225 (+) Transcript_25727:75-749(+)